jgi:Zn-dependent peptidase ImmA (M78 family)
MTASARGTRRVPHYSKAEAIARSVRKKLRLAEPTEARIETLAYMRGLAVDVLPSQGSRAVLLRTARGGVITVSSGLSNAERRFAVAHEWGHYEIHPNNSFAGLCTGDDLRGSYLSSGFEQEANAFAAEFLMPRELAAPLCDVRKVSFAPIERIAERFQVSLTAAALRFVTLCPERTALVCSRDRVVSWCRPGPDFGHYIRQGMPLTTWSLAIDLWEKGHLPAHPETVDASAWLERARCDEDMAEHAVALGNTGLVLSLLWIRG